MTKRLSIKICPDGRILAGVHGLKGKKCAEYIRILEEMLEAETVDSSYTPEYNEQEDTLLSTTQQQEIGGDH